MEGGTVIVIAQESTSPGQVPAEAIVLYTIYEPGVLAARLINPVTGFIERPVAGTAEKVPAVARLTKLGLGFPSF